MPSGSACDVTAALGRKFPRSGGVEADCREFSLNGWQLRRNEELSCTYNVSQTHRFKSNP